MEQVNKSAEDIIVPLRSGFRTPGSLDTQICLLHHFIFLQICGCIGQYNFTCLQHIAAVRNGKRLIVGHGFTKKDAIMRAVAWIEAR